MPQIAIYTVAAKEILKRYDKLPKTKKILQDLNELEEKKNTLMQEYSKTKSYHQDLIQYKKNYMGKEVER